MTCLCCIMLCFVVACLPFYGLEEKQNSCHQTWWSPLVNTSLISQFWKNIISLNFLTNPLYVHLKFRKQGIFSRNPPPPIYEISKSGVKISSFQNWFLSSCFAISPEPLGQNTEMWSLTLWMTFCVLMPMIWAIWAQFSWFDPILQKH